MAVPPGRNKLAYPAGKKPGFDPAHPASQQIALSVVSNGASYTDLIHGTLPTFGAGSTSPTLVMDGALGAATRHAAATATAVKVPGTVVAPTSGTFAVMARIVATAVLTYNTLITNPAGYLFFAVNVDASTYKLTLFTAADNFSTFTLRYGVPYFLGASGSLQNGGTINFVAKNLSTGQVVKEAVTCGSTFTNNNFGTIYLGNDNLNNSESNANVAAAMCSPNLVLAMPELLQWADDPWAFWYPRPTELMLVATTDWPPAGATGNPTSVKSTLRF